MERDLLTRGLIILGIAGLAAWSAYPPSQKVNLGLDLQGGMHLVLRVITEDAIGAETDNTIDTIESELESHSITGTSTTRVRGTM